MTVTCHDFHFCVNRSRFTLKYSGYEKNVCTLMHLLLLIIVIVELAGRLTDNVVLEKTER